MLIRLLFLKQLKLEVPYDPANLLLGVYPKEQKSESQRDISVPSYTVALFMLIKMQDLNRLKCPLMYERIHKMWSLHTVKYYSGLERKGILSHATTWMNLEDIMLSEISQSRKTNTM